jgi:formylglycine-generating enzyme required for sulfatase activity
MTPRIISRSINTILIGLTIISAALVVSTGSASASRKISVIQDLTHDGGKIGTYRALIIAIQDYQDPKIPDLETPLNDAEAMADLLKNRYGFVVETLLDRKATRRAIYGALRGLSAKARPEDSVLIYYAGHGDLDRQFNDGWWIPADATAGDPVTYLDNVTVQKAMSATAARHVLLISDSCYSGTLFGQARAMPPVINDKYYLSLFNEKSRWGMTSGNKTPVSDSGTEGHSVFAYQLIKALANNEKPYVSTQEIYTRIAPVIANNSEQTPLCRPIRNTGDQGGEFVFVASAGALVEAPGAGSLSIEANVSGAEVFVDGRRVGRSPLTGFSLPPGEHIIKVEKQGCRPYTRRIEAASGRALTLSVHLDPAGPVPARLYVDTEPADATIRILNIGPKYYQGMELAPGRYHVEVAAAGRETQKLWVTLGAGEDRRLDIRLDQIGAAAAPSEATGAATQDKKIRNSLGMEFVYIAPGTFTMGSPPSEPGRDDNEGQHPVTLTRGYYLQTTEVTVGQWREFSKRSGYKTEAETGGGAYMWTGDKWEKKKGTFWDNPGFAQDDSQPVTCVSWNDAQKFIDWLNSNEGASYRLPSEAEWEYAARAGSTTAFANSGITELKCGRDPNLDAMGWYCGNSGDKTHPVAQKQPNAWGLYDMHGNVWEWCQDWYGDYPSGAVTDPKGPSSGSSRVYRGGGWYFNARDCRSAVRYRLTPGLRNYSLGLRLARTP